MMKPAIDRKPHVVEIQIRQQFPNPLPIQQDRVVALRDHGIAAPREGVPLSVGVEQVHDSSLRMHQVVIQFPLQTFP